jgi:hypothetical protein
MLVVARYTGNRDLALLDGVTRSTIAEAESAAVRASEEDGCVYRIFSVMEVQAPVQRQSWWSMLLDGRDRFGSPT